MTKALISAENIKETTQRRNKKLHTKIAARLRTVSWSNYCNPTGVVKSVYGIQTFPLTLKAV